MAKCNVVIIGGGISGLSALHFLRRLKPQLSVRLFEADARLGGTIGTDVVDGFSFDWGPNGFLDREPLTLQLCDELGLTDHLERANENVTKRFILRGARLREVPMSPPKFLTSDILSLRGRLRVLGEPLVPGNQTDDDESIYDFVHRRIGTEAADYLVQPMVSGIYGGLANRLSLKSCFPTMREMESEYGSLFKAMLARKKKAKREGRKAGGPTGPGGWLTSFEGGLFRVIERFQELYGAYIKAHSPVEGVRREDGGYVVTLVGGEETKAGAVILALPSYQAATIVYGLSPELSQALSKIDYAPISVVCMGYERAGVRAPLDGFGFLVPRKECRKILGSIWTSSIFRERAPSGMVQFRTIVGGDGDHESMNLSDDELTSRVRDDLADILGIDGAPAVVRLYRWRHGIPQFKVGHSEIMRRIESELRTLGNIHITGNAYYGIGLNDCVKQSHKVAQGIQ